MARTYVAKGVHTSPDKAGVQNMVNVEDYPKDELGLNDKLYGVRVHGKANIYNGQWTDEKLSDSIMDFFDYCREVDLKPTKPLLRVWLQISKSQMNDWVAKPDKYGEKSVILGEAFDVMEAYLQGNIDKYPTGSIFLLKTSHGHIETSKVDVTSNTNVQSEDIKDLISKMGLDKTK